MNSIRITLQALGRRGHILQWHHSRHPSMGSMPLLNSYIIYTSPTAKKQPISMAGWYKSRKRGNRWDIVDKNKKSSNDYGKSGKNSFDPAKSNSSIKAGSSIAASQTNTKFSPSRFFNPWNELANIVPTEEMLHDKVESTTRTFGIVAALMGSLAGTLLTFHPQDGYDANREPVMADSVNASRSNNINRGTNNDNNAQEPFSPLPMRRHNTIPDFIEHVTFTHHVSGTSLLVSWGIPESKLDDIYTACCAGSFYSGVLTTVTSSVINAWLAATPPGGIRSFVRIHSWYIVALPALLGISTGLAGTALFIGLDREHGTPVSYVGLGGTIVGGVALGLITGRGWVHTYKSLTEAVKRSGRRGT